MEDILSQEQSSSRDQEQVYYARNKMPSCRIDDLIMISNSQGSYLFVNYNRDEDESPVFKIRNSRVDYGQLQLQLVVMEVIYPIPLYHHESERANILHAIRDGLAVVKETNHIITFSVGRMHHIEEVDLNIIDCVQPIKVKSPIYVKGDCESGICGEVKVERRPRITYKYFLSLKPKSGCVELNNRTGSWRYEGRCDEVENDFFEITVWDGLGGYATQRIYIKCEQEEKPIGVNVLNVPLPIVAASPLPIWGDVRVINTPSVSVVSLPEVTIASLPPVEVSGLVSVTVPEVVTVTVGQPIDVNVLTLPEVAIASLPAVEVSGLVSVTVPDVLTVTVEQPIDVNVLTLPEVAIASLPAVEISGLVSVTVPDVLTVTAEQPIDVNVLTLPEVTIASLPAVEVSGLVSVTVPDVLTVTAEQPIEVNVLTLPEVAIASLPAVEVSGLVSVTVPEVITVTVEQPIDVVVITTITTVADLNAYNYYETPLTSLYVPVAASAAVIYDISRSIDQTIFTHLASGDSVIAQIIISPTSNPDYFYPAGITQELSVTSPNYPFVSNYFGRYLGVSFSNDTVTPATVEVIAQSQGPIIES